MLNSNPWITRLRRKKPTYTPERDTQDTVDTDAAGSPIYAATDTQNWVEQARQAADRAARRGY